MQRRLARVTAGSADREIAAGLLAAAAAGLPTILVALLLPWLFGAVAGGIGTAILAGVWVHLLALGPAVALGGLASRPIARTAGIAVAVLLGGSVLAIVLGLSGSLVPFLVPPLMPAARYLAGGSGSALVLTFWAAAWTLAVAGGYWSIRRRHV